MTGIRIYRNREEAGIELAERLRDLDRQYPIVFGLVRGGMAVAAPIAAVLKAPIEPLIVRKIGHPSQPELGIGAIAPDGQVELDPRAELRFGADDEAVRRVIERETLELARRQSEFTGGELPDVRGRVCIVADDGLATGVSASVAGDYLRRQGAARRILAVAVCPPEALARMKRVWDEVEYLQCLNALSSVGQWYEDFRQLEDKDVLQLLEGSRSLG